ncbi:MAG: ComEC/Rec2 family competence protein [Clostridium sp.]|nr:ComEC/Rec2 family competence protein [Clostridium sp.]
MDRPLIYFFISMILGSITCILLNNIILDAVISVSFLICIFFICDKKIFFISVCFYIIEILSFAMYFNVNINSKMCIESRIISKNDYYTTVNYKGRKISVKGNLKNFDLGQRIKLKGYFTKEPNYEYGTIGTLKPCKVQKLNNDFIYRLYNLRKNMYNKFSINIGKKYAAQIMAISFGDKDWLSKDDKNNLESLGIVYIICVSGLHMLLVFKSVEKFLGIKIAIIFSVLYALFTGCQPSTIRALIMIIVLKYSKRINKNYDSLSALCFSGMILILAKPYYSVDMSFTISFLATLGIILFYKRIHRLLYKLPEKINKNVSINISTQIITIPYIFYTIRSISFDFIIGNLILIPMYSILIVLGNIALVFSKIDYIFKNICSIIYVFTTALKGAQSILLKVLPPIMYVPYNASILILTLYICFIFAKSGYKKMMYIPAILFILMIINLYSFFPKICCMQLKNGDGVILKYGINSVLVSNYCIKNNSEKQELEGKFQVNKFISNDKSGVCVTINKEYAMAIPKYEKAKGISFRIIKKREKGELLYVFKDVASFYGLNASKYYDIIKPDDTIKDKNNLPAEDVVFEIISGKIFELKK